MIEINQLIDVGFIVVIFFMLWENHKTQKLLEEVAYQHNQLTAAFQEFGEAVVADLEDVADVLNEDSKDD
jgi:hypothetical protein